MRAAGASVRSGGSTHDEGDDECVGKYHIWLTRCHDSGRDYQVHR